MSNDHEDCCREEALKKLLRYCSIALDLQSYDPNKELDWWLTWARRQENQVNNWLIEALNAIATADFNSVDEARSFSAMILKKYADTEPEKVIKPTGSDAVKDD